MVSSRKFGIFGVVCMISALGLAPVHVRAAKKAVQAAPAAQAPSPEALARADDLAIVNAVRPETERRLERGRVTFKIRTLRIVEGYALFEANVERPDGRPFGAEDGPPQIASAILRKVGNRWDIDTLRLGAAAPWSIDYCPRVPAGLLNDCPAAVAAR